MTRISKTAHLLCCTSLLLLALAATVVNGEGYRVSYPQQFFVSTGTTIPFPNMDPVAQSGAIYYDGVNERVRVDNFWMGMTQSLIADLKHNTGFVINNNVCKKLLLTGTLVHAGVPVTAVRNPDGAAVRGVKVHHYEGVESGDHLMHIDHYVRTMNISSIEDEEDRQITIPWRVQTRRSIQKEIAPPPAKVPNWRFFGEPLDELDEYETPSQALEQVVEDVAVTTDYYNFVPAPPDPSIFVAPTTCEEVQNEDPIHEFSNNVDPFHAQRTLTDLSFASTHGVKLMSELYGGTKKAAAQQQADRGDL